VKNRLLAVTGLNNIVIFGGDERQYQVLVNPDKSLQIFKLVN
jgi:Cu/Ag efflux pump CusA